MEGGEVGTGRVKRGRAGEGRDFSAVAEAQDPSSAFQVMALRSELWQFSVPCRPPGWSGKPLWSFSTFVTTWSEARHFLHVSETTVTPS